MDIEAQGWMQKNEWKKAASLFNNFLSAKDELKRRQDFVALWCRSECNYKLSNYVAVVEDCRRIVESRKADEVLQWHARKRLIETVFKAKRLPEAEKAAQDWLRALLRKDGWESQTSHRELIGGLSDLLDCFSSTHLIEQRFNICMSLLENRLPTVKLGSNMTSVPKPDVIYCMYCNISFAHKTELQLHCKTEQHELMIMSDEGRDWHYRPPPRGLNVDTYQLCENWSETSSCRYGIQCTRAHGDSELAEWHERFKYRQMKIKRACEKELFGKSYTEELLDKCLQSSDPNQLMCDKIEEVEDSCTSPLSVTVSSKNGFHEWNFCIQTKKPLKAIALLQDTHRNHFAISSISVKNCNVDLKSDQEWLSALSHQESYFPVEYKVKISFTTTIFGTFRQSVVFDFSTEPVLVKNLRVDVVPDGDLEKINEIRREIRISLSERWTPQNCDLVSFKNDNNDEWEQKLKAAYPCPREETFNISPDTIREKKFSKYNYRERMHELLFIEEMARFDLIKKYNMVSKLQIGSSYVLSPNSMATTTAKFASNGELYAKLELCRELSEDTSEGRLILKHCTSVYISPLNYDTTQKRKVYETYIEDKGKNTVYLKLSEQTVKELNLNPHSEIEVNAQFQINRLQYCEWHYTLDKMSNFNMIFPETYVDALVPWSPNRSWNVNSLDPKLNTKQKQAVLAITTSLSSRLPPILVIGPYGTGKTYTLAQAIKMLAKDASNKILLCTHSNSAADLYIKDYFDKWVMEGNENARPLRIYYSKRWVSTVTPVVQKYCLVDEQSTSRSFRPPTLDDIYKHQIVVVTLSTSLYLSNMGLPQGYFTHILLDEAAQAIECETITPLVLATDETRVVLAGDHMQLGPDIFSPFVKERNLHISLLERLYDYYPAQFSCKILLCENYRAHQSIIQFTSESFYDQRLVSSSKQPRHSKFFPLTFFTTRGEDVQEKNSTAFYNNSEVYEVAERVEELKNSWPEEWGTFNEQSIGVVAPYSDQVFRIRAELRRRKIENICVERVLNVQGKQFRAIILSTVRTRTTCKDDDNLLDILDYGFLSNSKLLNTAVTRAQSLVAVVGDPIALCSLGRCSKVWERFVQFCNDNNSLFGITWHQLKFQLHGIELKKIYNLNPLAPEFIPRSNRQQVVNNILGIDGYRQINNIPNNIQNNSIPNNNILNNNISNNVPPPIQNGLNIPLNHNIPLNIPNGVNIQPNLIKPVIPPQYSYQDRFYAPPVILPPQRPILFNIQQPIPNLVPQPIPNGFNVINPQIVVPQRPVQNIPQIQLQKTQVQMVQTPKLSPYLQNKQQQQITQQQQQHANNKLIQFMNNVHFPQTSQSALNDCINLLPQNMTLADMLLQPRAMQEKWYLFLRDNLGENAADKFKYLLQTTNQKGIRPAEKSIFESTTPQSCDSPSWFDSPTSQININKPVYMRDQLVEQCNGFGQIQLPNGIPNGLNVVSNGFSPQPNPYLIQREISREQVNGFGGLNVRCNEQELQRHINEEFANLSVNTEVNDVFKAFTDRELTATNGVRVNRRANVGPRFYKFFH